MLRVEPHSELRVVARHQHVDTHMPNQKGRLSKATLRCSDDIINNVSWEN